MIGLVLAAGYATRLYPLTENFPKPLLKVGGITIVERIVDNMFASGVDKAYVITNDRFSKMFQQWSIAYEARSGRRIFVVNDGTSNADDRRGAIGDIHFTVKLLRINDDILVVGGDNLFQFGLNPVVKLMRGARTNVIAGYDVASVDLAKSYGVLELDDTGKVISFQEKPSSPRSTICSMCIYAYPRTTLRLLDDYMASGLTKDAPGNFAAWLSENDRLSAVVYTDQWHDIGDFQSLKAAKEHFGEVDVDVEALKQTTMTELMAFA